MGASPSRRRLLIPLLLSALVHLALGFWLWRDASDPPAPARAKKAPSEPIWVEWAVRDAPTAPPVSPPPPPAKPPKRPRAVPRVERPAPPPPSAPAAQAEAPQQSPPAEVVELDVPRAPVLVPSWMRAPPATGSLAVRPPSGGRTLRPGDAALQGETRQEEAERLTARVQTWVDDDMAQGRAQGLGAHPYLQDMRHSLEGALARTEGGSPQAVGIRNPLAGLVKNYTEAAAQYGRSGAPGHTPPERTPLHSERLAERFRHEPDAVRALIGPAQALETLQALESRGALLTVKLVLRHDPAGALLGARVEESSGNRLFDAFVLKVVPASLGTLQPPPDVVLRGKGELRTRWLVEGWHQAPRRLTQALTSSLMTGSLMLPLDLLTETEELDPPTFDYRAKLIGVY